MSQEIIPLNPIRSVWHTSDRIDSTAIVLADEPVAAPSVEQGVILVSDGSVSMSHPLVQESGVAAAGGSKAQAAARAAQETVARLRVSSIAPNLSLGFIAFHDRVTIRRPIVPVRELSGGESFDPTAAGTGGTCVAVGLEAARAEIERWRGTRTGRLPISNVVLVLTDGLDSDPSRTRVAAAQLVELADVDLGGCLFTGVGEPPEGAALLREIVTQPRLFATVHTADALRSFFLNSITIAGDDRGR